MPEYTLTRVAPDYSKFTVSQEEMMAAKKSVQWHLMEGDRIIFWEEDRNGVYPTGTISRVNYNAGFFPYCVKWDPRWDGKLTEGGFQSSCFNWSQMICKHMRPENVAARTEEIEFRRRLAKKVRVTNDDEG